MKEKEMKKIAEWLNEIVKGLQESKFKLKVTDERDKKLREEIIRETNIIFKINKQVKQLCKKFPIKKAY